MSREKISLKIIWKFSHFPFSLLRRQDEKAQSYEDILQTSKAFNNRACVQTLYQRLKQRFEQIHDDVSSPSNTNDILRMTLIKSFKRFESIEFYR